MKTPGERKGGREESRRTLGRVARANWKDGES